MLPSLSQFSGASAMAFSKLHFPFPPSPVVYTNRTTLRANFRNDLFRYWKSCALNIPFFHSDLWKGIQSGKLAFHCTTPNESSSSSSSENRFPEPNPPSCQAKSELHFPPEAIPTDCGYLAVDYEKKSSLYYIFYEAQNPERPLKDTPLIIWLNGGPGCSSLIGCFYELGPYVITDIDLKLKRNEYAWNRRYGLVFIDNPIGTGFSITENESKVPRNQDEVADHFLHALSALYLHHPTFQYRPLILAGESYAGKYLPSITQRLLYGLMDKKNKKDTIPVKLLGMAIGNSLVHPRSQVMMHAEVSHSLGLLDKEQSLQVDKRAKNIVELIDKGEWIRAHKERTELCEWIEKTGGIPTLLDVRRNSKYHATEDGQEFLSLYLNDSNVKQILNANPEANWMSCNPKIRALMAEDTMKSTKPNIEALLSLSFPVLLFQGVYDAKDGPASCESWMRILKWKHNENFWESQRDVWKVGRQLVGYKRSYENLSHVVLTGAGHQVPVDQPRNSLLMIENWIENWMKVGRFFT